MHLATATTRTGPTSSPVFLMTRSCARAWAGWWTNSGPGLSRRATSTRCWRSFRRRARAREKARPLPGTAATLLPWWPCETPTSSSTRARRESCSRCSQAPRRLRPCWAWSSCTPLAPAGRPGWRWAQDRRRRRPSCVTCRARNWTFPGRRSPSWRASRARRGPVTCSGGRAGGGSGPSMAAGPPPPSQWWAPSRSTPPASSRTLPWTWSERCALRSPPRPLPQLWGRPSTPPRPRLARPEISFAPP
mmetsp:Transcript_4015/g.14078  ORF Transcript_4015/g.14078 Transcript_4015/m.14078 type:complete len:247 (+) Transcript_4015:1411-2151(+)